jgi:micrococcal nuclease
LKNCNPSIFLASLLIVSFWLVSLAQSAEFSGPVVSVLDGDTLEVLHNNRPERIRLSGIDCPEKGQAYGTRAKQAASALVYGKEVTFQTHGRDEYGLTFGDVILPEDLILNQELTRGAKKVVG